MELFEVYEGPSIHDILRESLDDEMNIMRAMHTYEMKSIYMEAAEKIDEDELVQECCKMKSGVKESFGPETDVLMEAASDIIERMRASAKTFFEKLKGWIKSVILNITNNAKVYQKFVESHQHGINLFVSKGLDFEPTSYKVHGFTLSGLIAFENNDIDRIRKLAEKAMKGDKDAYEQLKATSAVDDGMQLYRVQLAKTHTHDDLTDDKIFRRELMKRFANKEDIISTVDGSVVRFFENFLKSGYTDCIKEYKKESQRVDEEYRKMFKLFADLERELKHGGPASGSLSKDEIVSAVNKVWNATKRSQTDAIMTFNVYREASAECASIGKKVIEEASRKGELYPAPIPKPMSVRDMNEEMYRRMHRREREENNNTESK